MEFSQQIITASMRARGLIQRMLAFARQTPVEAVRVDAVSLVRNILKMIRISLPAGVSLQFRHDIDTAWVVADPLQVEQIVMNLCMNAADAMEGNSKLDIIIRLAEPLALSEDDTTACPRLDLIVDDDGCGMSPQVQQRALDPFYTTKEPGKGSGLGLSVVYGIVRDLGGQLTIHSVVGMGSSFQISLPLDVSHQPDILAPAALIQLEK